MSILLTPRYARSGQLNSVKKDFENTLENLTQFIRLNAIRKNHRKHTKAIAFPGFDNSIRLF
jgi:hypothetical protein